MTFKSYEHLTATPDLPWSIDDRLHRQEHTDFGNELVSVIFEGLYSLDLHDIAPELASAAIDAIHREISKRRHDLEKDDTTLDIMNPLLAEPIEEDKHGDPLLPENVLRQMARINTIRSLEDIFEAMKDRFYGQTLETWHTPGQRAHTEDAPTAKGTRVVICGIRDVTNPRPIVQKLEKIRNRYPDMVLITQGQYGTEAIAEHWATAHNVSQVTITPSAAQRPSRPMTTCSP